MLKSYAGIFLKIVLPYICARFMKLKFTYLLLLCLLFFKGYSFDVPPAQKVSIPQISAQHIQNGKLADITSSQTPHILSELSLYSDDNDDDELSHDKKKTIFKSCSFQQNSFSALSSYLHNLKNLQQPNGHSYCTHTGKYILLRVIRV
jgi:hypothetical protein